MTSYRVVPDGSGWKVMRAKQNNYTHSTISTHRLKRAAISAARTKASAGDQLVILDGDGEVQRNMRVQS